MTDDSLAAHRDLRCLLREESKDTDLQSYSYKIFKRCMLHTYTYIYAHIRIKSFLERPKKLSRDHVEKRYESEGTYILINYSCCLFYLLISLSR